MALPLTSRSPIKDSIWRFGEKKDWRYDGGSLGILIHVLGVGGFLGVVVVVVDDDDDDAV